MAMLMLPQQTKDQEDLSSMVLVSVLRPLAT